MRLHHDKHHQAYVDNLNKAVEGDSSLQGKSLEELLQQASKMPPAVRNNGGGHWNHMFFWETMSPSGGTPQGPLLEAINGKWDSFDKFQEAFNAKGAGQFGSGWVWLVGRYGGALEVISTPNQDNPLMDLVEGGYVPILGNDVWEHAYYLTYNNRRADYLKAWWQVVNWDVANDRFAKIG
jgi:Fe-Mn family superoxide dismutase